MQIGSRWVNGREMKRGYTTGSCAAAAAKAAMLLLFTGQAPDQVELITPGGIRLNLELLDIQREPGRASCAVRKDAGDDPDITNGVLVYAQARETSGGIEIKGGQGVGVVTRPGLPVEVGRPSINPIPLKMIREEADRLLPPGKGVEITISIPGGEELAKKTFNPRLGIVGGLSILGTTGIVEPMSQEAWQESLRLELAVIARQGHRRVILVPGNYGETFACNTLGLKNQPLVKMSNYVGYTLKAALSLGFSELLLVGDVGKFIKVAAGIFNTHSGVADARMEIMAAYAASLGADQDLVQKILECNTTGAALALLEHENLGSLYGLIAGRVSLKAKQHIYGEAAVGTVLYSNSKGLLAIDEEGKNILARFKNE